MGYMQVSSNVSTFHVGTMFATVAMVPRVLWRCCNMGSGMGKMYLGSDVVSCRYVAPGCTSDTIT